MEKSANAGILLIASVGMIITALGLIGGDPTATTRPCHADSESITCNK